MKFKVLELAKLDKALPRVVAQLLLSFATFATFTFTTFTGKGGKGKRFSFAFTKGVAKVNFSFTKAW